MKIKVKGSNLEMLDIEVNEEQVQEMWNTNSEQLEQIKQLTKDVARNDSVCQYRQTEIDTLQRELGEAHLLLTMLGVEEKSKDEESYNKVKLSIATRIALYIAGKLNA